MSTQFRTATTDQFAFERFCAGASGAAVEFVTRANEQRVFDAGSAGETFVGEDGTVMTFADLMEFAVRGATFVGRKPVTMEFGESLDFELEE